MTSSKGGRPRKPPLTDEELNIAVERLFSDKGRGDGGGRRRGFGLRAVATEISRRRGAYKSLDSDERRDLAVGKSWLVEELARRGYHVAQDGTRAASPPSAPTQAATTAENRPETLPSGADVRRPLPEP